MSFEVETKEEVRKRKPKKVLIPKISYFVSESASEEDTQRRLAKVYDIIFSKVYKKMYSVDKLN